MVLHRRTVMGDYYTAALITTTEKIVYDFCDKCKKNCCFIKMSKAHTIAK